jgi:hypothetical protein
MNQPQTSTHSTFRLAIVHWFPLEQFPPVQNILEFFGEQSNFQVLCCATERKGEQFAYRYNKVQLHRTTFPSPNHAKLARLAYFLYFPFSTFLKLIFFRPNSILYIEPHSAPAVFFYSLLFPGCRIFVHYHEYREPKHLFLKGNALARIGNWLERIFLFHKTTWISHTNTDRIRLFLNDFPKISSAKLHALPNMPPKSWIESARKVTKKSVGKLKLVYIGAISLHDTYLESLLDWFHRNHQKGITLDIYITNVDPATKSFLSQQRIDGLAVHFGGVPYDQLPFVLPRYDIGLILYRCNTVNYIYNAPNKLFEYLVCGLNVLFPLQMLGVQPYSRNHISPWVKSVDFDKLQELTVDELRTCNGINKPWDQTCESIYESLLNQMLNR